MSVLYFVITVQKSTTDKQVLSAPLEFENPPTGEQGIDMEAGRAIQQGIAIQQGELIHTGQPPSA